MPNIEEFEAWIKSKGGQKGLVALFKKKINKDAEVSQTAISNWLSRRKVPVGERREQLKELGWDGPYEWPEPLEQGRVTGALPEHVADAYQIIFEAVQAASSDLMAIDPKKAGLVIGLVAQEVAKGGKEEVRTTLVRRAEVLLGLG